MRLPFFRGLILNGSSDEISAQLIDNVTITGNFIGTNATGSAESTTTSTGFGIRLNGGNNHKVGGPNPADRNLISGNRQGGIFVGLNASDGLLVQGNYIGSDASGTAQVVSVALGTGIIIRGDGGITVGGSGAARRT